MNKEKEAAHNRHRSHRFMSLLLNYLVRSKPTASGRATLLGSAGAE
jgi:hypothetical protein